MTKAEFKALPLLLVEHQVVAATGYASKTLRKLVDCGVLALVKPNGCGWGRYQKLQVARLAGIAEGEVLEDWKAETAKRPFLIGEKQAGRLTGLTGHSLPTVFTPVRPAGAGGVRYRVEEIAAVCGISKGGKRGKKGAKEARTASGPLTGKGEAP